LINPLFLVRASKYSARGLAYAAKNERAFQQELALLLIAVIAAFFLSDSHIERTILIGSVAALLVVELINSSIESVVDRIGREHNAISQRAKDLSSAAVLVSLLIAVSIWGIFIIR
jgi:diacylglycerol kinase (ATP)